MAINLATKYSDKIASYFSLKSVVDGNTNNDYRFTGAATVQIYTPVTQPLTDYSRTGLSRYGSPAEMQDHTQELALGRDRAFAITIDRGNNDEQMNVKEAGRMLALELDEQVIPEMDRYALGRFIDHAGKIETAASAPTKTDIVTKLSDAMVWLSNKKVPKDGRVIYLGWTYLGVLRTSAEFMGNDTLGSAALRSGAIGSFMGAAVVPVPDEYLKKGSSTCYFLITHKNAVLQPKTIQDYFVKQNPPGINGALLEGRFRYDAFVLGAKADGVYALAASGAVQAAPTLSYTANTKTLSFASASASKIVYTLDGTDPRYSKSALIISGASGTISLSAFAGKTVTIKAVALSGSLFTSAVASLTQVVAA